MRARWIVLLALSSAIVPACSSGGSDSAARVTTSTTARGASATTTTSSTTVPTTVAFDGTTADATSKATAGSTAFLRSIRVSHGDGVDRVTFQFDGSGRPASAVGYVARPVADGSGEAVAVQGAASLKVRLEPSSMTDLRGSSPIATYTGPDRVTGDSRVVTEVVKGGDFEGVVTWFVGVRRRAPFRIRVLTSTPSELTIELAAP